MPDKCTIGLIGDYQPNVPAHRAIPLALELAAREFEPELGFEWVPTEELRDDNRVSHFSGLWCVPASPYRSMAGALKAIQHARERGIPFLGTCGGFQHALIEYARNVLGWADAEHGETAPEAARAIIAPLECALVEAAGTIQLLPGSRIAAAYGAREIVEEYRCRYGLNPKFRRELLEGSLRPAALDKTGDVRAVELDGHPFFVATLFQPERAALKGKLPPLVKAFSHAIFRRGV